MTKTLMLAAFVAVMLSPSGARAQAETPSLKLPTLVFAAASAGDWASTAYFREHGGREGNPLLAWAHPNTKAQIALGASMDVAGVWAWNRFVGRKHRKLAAVGLYAASAFRGYLIAKNIRYGNQRKQFIAEHRRQYGDHRGQF